MLHDVFKSVPDLCFIGLFAVLLPLSTTPRQYKNDILNLTVDLLPLNFILDLFKVNYTWNRSNSSAVRVVTDRRTDRRTLGVDVRSPASIINLTLDRVFICSKSTG